MRRLIAIASLMLAFAAAPAAAADKYDIDPNHSQVQFGWTHFGFSNLWASFDRFDGELMLDPADWAKSSVSVTIPLDSVDTGVAKLDTHLRSPDFFDTAKFPNATFKSTRVEATGEKTLKVHGDLTLHGITKPVVLDVTINAVGKHPMTGKQTAGFDATATVSRADFKVEMYAPNVSDQIRIRISTETNKAGGDAPPAEAEEEEEDD